MGSAEEYERERARNAQSEEQEAPPAYSVEASPQEILESASATTSSKRPDLGTQDDAAAAAAATTGTTRPTVDSPFDFPSYSELPEVISSSSTAGGGDAGNSNGGSSSSSAPPVILAIPQIAPKPTSVFPSVYNRSVLLRRGIPQETFTSFLTTLSAFLTATVSERALKHAADVGRSLNNLPKKFSEDTVAHVKGVGKHIEQQARKGKYVAAGIGVLAGTVSIPLATAFRVVGATFQIPGAVGSSISKKPLTPRERADAYLVVANSKWFGVRGLTATLCDTLQLFWLLEGAGTDFGLPHPPVGKLVDRVRQASKGGPEAQFQALETEFGITSLEIVGDQVAPLDIGASTLWLVLTEVR
ncbi:hypothetical protein F5Y08DRAFT_248358 [Xylaria arbuscula]|nr:hypothetical protein F5Y08DRAFT_248358 [Xylaria arbuscula]